MTNNNNICRLRFNKIVNSCYIIEIIESFIIYIFESNAYDIAYNIFNIKLRL